MEETISRQDCKHDEKEDMELHTCPYLTELYQDETLCDCCRTCLDQCAVEI